MKENITVLLVDDHQIIRDGIKFMLSGLDDITVIGLASNGTDAMEFIKQNAPDIVIMDISMPQMTGIETTKKITEKFPNTKVLILSMYVLEDYIFNAITAGAKGYILKQDTTKEELMLAIRKIYNGKEHFSDSISKIVMNSYLNRAKKNEKADDTTNYYITAREKEVLKLFVEGFSNKEIADKLFISVRTVDTHKNNIMQKFNFKSSVDMVKFAIRNNLVEF